MRKAIRKREEKNPERKEVKKVKRTILITTLLLVGAAMYLGQRVALGASVVDPRTYIDSKYITEYYGYQGRTLLTMTDQDGNVTHYKAGRKTTIYNSEGVLVLNYHYDGARLDYAKDHTTNLTTLYDHGRPDKIVDENNNGVMVTDYIYGWELDPEGNVGELANLFNLNLGDGNNRELLQDIASTFSAYMEAGKSKASLAFVVNFAQTENDNDGNAIYATSVTLYDENNDQASTIEGFTDPNPEPEIAPLSSYDRRLPASDQAIIKQAKKDWADAYARGDKEAMDAAHERAEEVRAKYGYSGGSDGSKHIPLNK
jgi:hypothetical protein